MIGWIVALIFLALLLFSCRKIERTQDEVRAEQEAHRNCHVHTMNALRTAVRRTDAAALLTAADEYESIEGQARLKTLANTEYKPGGPSMPVIWLRDRAERLHPGITDPDDGLFTYSGERVQ